MTDVAPDREIFRKEHVRKIEQIPLYLQLYAKECGQVQVDSCLWKQTAAVSKKDQKNDSG